MPIKNNLFDEALIVSNLQPIISGTTPSSSQKNYSPKDFGKVAVLLGGTSSEREVSLESGQGVYQALKSRGVDAHLIDPIDGIIEHFINHSFDSVFIVLHGKPGEDGIFQGFFDVLGIPYTGSGVAASALAMDKARSKLIFEELGIPTLPFGVADTLAQAQSVAKTLNYPLAVKPVGEGSSIGVTRIANEKELPEAFYKAAFYGAVIIEEWKDGKDFFVGVLGGNSLPSVQVSVDTGFYDYQAKYKSNETKYYCPAPISQEQEERVREIAYRAFRAVGGEGWGRVDLVQDQQGQFWVLEVNTIPGMTSHSLFPMAAKAIGLSYEDVVIKILTEMLDKQLAEEKSKQTSIERKKA